jgi:hypothetical protein
MIPPGAVLRRIAEEVGHDLGQAHMVGSQIDRVLWFAHVQPMPARPDQRFCRLHGVPQDVVQRRVCGAQLDLSQSNPRHVEQVVQQAGQMLQLPIHVLHGTVGDLPSLSREPEDLQGVQQRGERVTQLVREHRKEFVLPAIGHAELFIEATVLDRDGDARREVVHELQVPGVEPSSGAGWSGCPSPRRP